MKEQEYCLFMEVKSNIKIDMQINTLCYSIMQYFSSEAEMDDWTLLNVEAGRDLLGQRRQRVPLLAIDARVAWVACNLSTLASASSSRAPWSGKMQKSVVLRPTFPN
ncbi:hypothetical protein T06_8032 [Trichinella sp. T6]|nr:hypothetical protein T06_8032 [Trichinella sp. T6]